MGPETLFIPGDSRLHRLHPFNKLSLILVTGVIVYLLPGPFYTATAILAAALAAAKASKVFAASFKIIRRTILPLALFMLPIHGMLYPGNQTSLTGWHGIIIYQEGVAFALVILIKLAALLAVSLLFVLTTHPADLVTAVSRATGSASLAYLLGSPLLLLPSVRRRVRMIQAAQQARGMDPGSHIIKRFTHLPALVVPLVIGAIIEIEQRSIALELRGFKSGRAQTALREVPDSLFQRRARQVMLAACAAGLIFRLWNP